MPLLLTSSAFLIGSCSYTMKSLLLEYRAEPERSCTAETSTESTFSHMKTTRTKLNHDGLVEGGGGGTWLSRRVTNSLALAELHHSVANLN